MAEGSCGICLDDLKNPVSTPCGHLHCEKCLISHVEANSDAITASCPSCRTAFPIATPDLRFVPAKYHRFIIPSVRRVFVDPPAETTKLLKANVARLEERVRCLEQDKSLLMERCEASMAASSKHAEGERDARIESERLRKEMQELRKKYEEVKRRYKSQKESRDSGALQLATKRKSNQASLDASSSSSSSQLFRFGEHDDPADRPLSRIIKRPRLLASPFNPDKMASVAPLARPVLFKKGRTSVLLSLEHAGPRRILGTPEERSTSSALISSVGSSGPGSAGPQRSGLPTGDLFSPESNRTLTGSSSVDFSLRSSDDILVEDEDD
ncbi:uncharacterized protein C8Q71DRAFT_262521 [Rhodofomes roseus]|uniref:RING-type domain-containing protein n=1 Tax=Rhodofomes roseus TaxID=34475 RepID=A0ABQ8K6E0_9APHY|nr:uncharacterized protein C8Q71DRAFT_262521 [Rhodofomes roseus]KAH9832644.1 hypothetical protein C8Q71DRAFT_262521 [Rhodofomes roseus]